MQFARPIRRPLAYIVGGLIGVWIGIGIFQVINMAGTYLGPLSVCNGVVFCSRADFAVFVLAGGVSGSCGAVSSFIVPRLLLRQRIVPSDLFAYGLAGSILWVGIGVLTFFLVVLSNLDSTLGWPAGSAIIISLIGVSMGGIMAMLPHNRYGNTL